MTRVALVDERKGRTQGRFDLFLCLLVFALAAFGVLSISVASFSTSSAEEDTLFNYIVASYYGMRQAIFFFVAPIVIAAVVAVPYEWIRRRSALFYYASLLLLGIALAGKAAGVKAWIDMLWGFTIQPSEFVKIAVIIALAKVFERSDQPMDTFREFARVMIMVAIPSALTLMQGEMGSLMVVIFIFGVMMYFAGVRLRLLVGMVTVGVVAIVTVYGVYTALGLESYRIERVLSFVNPSLASEASVYQVNNSKIAIGSGGMRGIGMFVQGSFSQLDYVPEDWTDFIFSTIGEAFGFVGCVAVVLVYLVMILRMIYLARFTQDKFGQMIIIGIMAMMLFHVFENIAMTVGLMPVTGIPLPFLSYGGSNLVTNMAGIGLVLNVTKNRSLSVLQISTSQTPQTRVNRYRNLRTPKGFTRRG